MANEDNDDISKKIQIAIAVLGAIKIGIEVFDKLAESYRKNGIDKAVGSFFTKEEEPKKNKRRRNRNRNKHKMLNGTDNREVLTNKTITKTKKDMK